MKAKEVIALVSGALWAGLIVSGVRIIGSATAQGIPGSPNEGQVQYYVYIPVVMVCLVTATYLLSRRVRFICAALFVQVSLFLALFPYILFYTGGM